MNRLKLVSKHGSSFLVFYEKSLLFKNIESLQNYFVITYVDKSPDNYAIMGKAYYPQLLSNILTGNKTFSLSNNINNHKINNFHILLKINDNNIFNYPYLVLILKFHKITY